MSEGRPPERRFEIGIRISADDREAVISALLEIERVLSEEGRAFPVDVTSAGGPFSFVVFGVENPDMTQERYFEQLDEWMNRKRYEISPADGPDTITRETEWLARKRGKRP